MEITTPLNKMQTMQFKIQQIVTFFTAVNHCSRPLRKLGRSDSTESKGVTFIRCDWWISIHFISLCTFTVHCHNYDWQQYTVNPQINSWVLKFRVFMLLKGAVAIMAANFHWDDKPDITILGQSKTFTFESKQQRNPHLKSFFLPSEQWTHPLLWWFWWF